MTVCNVQGITQSDKSTENYYQTPNSALWGILGNFTSSFWFYGPQTYCWFTLALEQKALKPTVCYLSNIKGKDRQS